MTWNEVCVDRRFRDFPGRIETNAQGQIIMSPAKNRHALFQGRIVRWLDRLMDGGEVFPECAIETSDGVKVGDVAWAESPQVERLVDVPAWPESPSIVVEVMSGSDSPDEMAAKGKLYFEKGAEEYWVCDESGNLTFHDASGPLERSRRCPAFPFSVGS